MFLLSFLVFLLTFSILLCRWCRPNEIHESPVYFDQYSTSVACHQGTLSDEIFLGTLMAISVYSKYDLIENIFASRPTDFLKYGVYTCRFYVNGEWVEVITDTMLPCTRNNRTSEMTPVYGRSHLPNEIWISLVEKAFAKAMGSYEAISHLKIQKALLHLTGGSVQHYQLRDDVSRLDAVNDQYAWSEFKARLLKDGIILLLPEEKKVDVDGEAAVGGGGHGFLPPQGDSPAPAENKIHPNRDTHKEDYFIPNRVYSVILTKDIGGYELVLMHCPWSHPSYLWSGEWSDSSSDWEQYPELLVEIERDPNIPWRRRQPNGYFWISFRQLIKFFNKMYVCLIFPNDKFNFYCIRGECRGRQAGGPLQTVRDRETVLKEANKSRTIAVQKATAAVVVDGDAAWFNNPQYRLNVTPPHGLSNHAHSHHHSHQGAQAGGATSVMAYISIIPLGNGDDGDAEQAQMAVTILSSPKTSPSSLHVPIHLWDVSQFEVVAVDKFENGPILARGQETSIWAIELDSHHYYHIVPNTSRRGREGDFILRVFTSRPVYMETIPPMHVITTAGEWKRVGDLDTTGGPPFLLANGGQEHGANGGKHHQHHKDNAKWCQNPQYHLQVANPYGKDELYLKIVLRKHDAKSVSGASGKGGGGGSTGAGSKASAASAAAMAADEKKNNAMVGLIICKAEALDESVSKSKKKAPRQNKLGEPIPNKASSLKKRREDDLSGNANTSPIQPPSGSSLVPKTVLRKLSVDPEAYHVMSTFCSKTETTIFYPKLPRSWMPDGLLLVPCLSEKGVKGHYDLEVYSSDDVLLTALPETYSRSISGEWTESTAGGCHLYPTTWKKNPKFQLRFHNPVHTDAPARLRITIAKLGAQWKSLSKKDTVGCMIGFYVFLTRGTEQIQMFESTFVPDEENSTDSSFSLPQLSHGESYTLMPTTFADGKHGAFVISILSEYEFHIAKEK